MPSRWVVTFSGLDPVGGDSPCPNCELLNGSHVLEWDPVNSQWYWESEGADPPVNIQMPCIDNQLYLSVNACGGDSVLYVGNVVDCVGNNTLTVSGGFGFNCNETMPGSVVVSPDATVTGECIPTFPANCTGWASPYECNSYPQYLRATVFAPGIPTIDGQESTALGVNVPQGGYDQLRWDYSFGTIGTDDYLAVTIGEYGDVDNCSFGFDGGLNSGSSSSVPYTSSFECSPFSFECVYEVISGPYAGELVTCYFVGVSGP